MSWLSWILDDDPFLTRSHCGPGWSDDLIAVNQFGNILIAIAYFSIGLSLIFLYIKISRFSIFTKNNPWIVFMFGTFITLCGMTHLADVAVFYYAGYRLFTIIDFATGIISLITAVVLPVAINEMIKVIPNDENL